MNMKKGKRSKNPIIRISILLVALLIVFIGIRKVIAVVGEKKAAEDKYEDKILIGDKSPVNLLLSEEIRKIEEMKAAEIQAEKKAEIIAKREEEKKEEMEGKKVIYLTFDDGPSEVVTPMILDILDQYGIKATFFVVGNMVDRYPEIVKDTYERGHLVGNHSYSHNYSYIYGNNENFLADFSKAGDTIQKAIGSDYRPDIIRFPGGSFGDGKSPMRQAALNAGYKYYDWNVVNGDAEGINRTPAQLVNRTAETLGQQRIGVVLMHDTDAKMNTAQSLVDTIEYLISRGYEFDTLDNYIY